MSTRENKRLSEQSYWNEIYSNSKPTNIHKLEHFASNKNKQKQAYDNYSEYIFWENIIKKYLPLGNSIKFVEIGSAPGTYLLNFHSKQGYDVYGIEYTAQGYEVNKANFANAGLSTENVIYGDMFDIKLQDKYHEYFDIVYSGGLIEHFSNPEEVIDQHLKFLKPGGILLITIPNLKYLNYGISKFLNADVLNIHNLNIMDQKSFSGLFENKDLTTLHKGYYGTLNFGLFNAQTKLKKAFLRILLIIGKPLNMLFYYLFGNKGKESKYFSPYLIYIGIKKSTNR